MSGPGDYNMKIPELNLSKYTNCRRYGAFSKSGVKTDRLSWDPLEGPDPGKYQNDVSSFIMSPKNVKFGRSSKQLTVREKSPGPGTYNPKDSLTTRKNQPKIYTASVRNLN